MGGLRDECTWRGGRLGNRPGRAGSDPWCNVSALPGVYLPLPHLPFHVLLALAETPRHGWAIVKRIAEMTEGPEPSSGSLYVAISRLKERGLVEDAPATA